VGERAGVEEAGKSSSQVPGEGNSPPGRGFLPDLDESDSDLDISVPMYAINDPEFCTELMVRTVLLLSPNAIQQVSKTPARTPSTVKHPFPVLTRYFVAKERDFRAICADFLRHRELLKQGEAAIFLHDDHPKPLYIVARKFRAVKATYRSYRASDMPNDSINIQLIKQHMTECMIVYYSVLPQLDMLAAYHNIPLSDTVSNHGGDLGLLRSEGARQRRSAIVDQDLRDQLSDTTNYVNTQAAAQSQGLQRRYDFQERTLMSREEELRINSEAMRREAERRRGVEEELSRVREELRQSNLEIIQGRIRRPYDRPGKEEANCSENARRLRDGNIHSADYNRREINHSENRRNYITSGERDVEGQNRPSSSQPAPQTNQDVGMQMIQALSDATAAAGGGPHSQNNLVEEYPCGMTMIEYYNSLPEPWDVALTECGSVKELHKVKFTEKFSGDRMGYAVWRRRFFTMVHTQRMLVADKAVALSAALDTKQGILSQVVRGLNYDTRTYAAVIRELERLFGGAEAEVMLASTELFKGLKVVLSSLNSVKTFRVKLVAYRTILETHGQRKSEFAPNSHLYRELMQSKLFRQILYTSTNNEWQKDGQKAQMACCPG
jgi:hypothetical protein